MTPGHLIRLAEVAARTEMLDITCSRCQRRGRLSIARLIAQHGPDTPLAHAAADLSAECPNRRAHQEREQCDVYFPGLAALMGH